MHRLRSALVMLLWAPPWVLAILIAGLGGHGAGYRPFRLWARSSWRLAGVRLRVEGAPQQVRPRIFVSNHPSPMDPLWLMTAIPGRLVAIAKREMASLPVIGWILRACGWIFLDRADRRAALGSLEQASERLRSGDSVLLFPEGRRSGLVGDLLPFKKGAFHLALGVGTAVWPVVLLGWERVLPPGAWVPRAGEIVLRFGAPVPVLAGETPDQLAQRVRVVMRELLDQDHQGE